MRLFVVTRGYPSPDRLYNHGFVHRRVVAYRRLGIETTVFWLRNQQEPSHFSYDGIDVTIGSVKACLEAISATNPDAVAAHAPADDFGPLFAALQGRKRIVAWIYGSEMMPFYRVTELQDFDSKRWNKAKTTFERRIRFWRDFLSEPHPDFLLNFPSDHARNSAESAVGFPIKNASVLPSPVDTALFQYLPKPARTRYNILSVRPFNDWRYANDLSVDAILQLRDHPCFDRMRFTFVGMGHLFDEILAPLRNLPNVVCENRSISQQEIAEAHQKNGIFLCPTRDDAQGVARDEAMASGLVVASNSIGAVPEFADQHSAILAGSEDARGIAEGVARIIDDATLFTRKSQVAAQRVRQSLAMEQIIPRELALLEGRK